MFDSFKRHALALAATCALGVPASAQTTAHPADAAAAVPPPPYRSAFAGYKRSAEPHAADAFHVLVRGLPIGGWRAYAREANAPASAPAAQASAPAHRH
jgi:hypothetical protein